MTPTSDPPRPSHPLRTAAPLAAVLSVRLLGLFMIYPVFSAYARHLTGATGFTTGLALGIYGLTQGLLQIPFGIASDRLGRKRMIVAGLLLFALGSAVAALSTSIWGVVVGRALQGGGAIGSVVLALVADLTPEEQRTGAMALVGISIGASFLVAVVAGPLLAGVIGVAGIFWLMVGLAAAGIGIILLLVPNPARPARGSEAGTVPALLGGVLRDRELLRLDFGIFALHAVLTASFLALPQVMRATLGLASDGQWLVYLPVLLLSVGLMAPALILAERYRRMKPVFLGGIVTLLSSQLLLLILAGSAYAVIIAALVFFTAFNVMESVLPSLITRTAPPEARGTATGVYSSAQFIGIFCGGVFGGLAQQLGGTGAVFTLTSLIAVVWLLIAAGMTLPAARTQKTQAFAARAD